MTGLNYKKIIILVLALAMLPLYSRVSAQETAPGTEVPQAQTFGTENFIPGVTGQPTSASPTEASKPKLDSLYQMVSQVQCSETWFGPCITRFIAWIAFWILVLVSAFFQVFGIVFDLATAVTLDPQTYNLEPIRIGWSIARDTANLFFIFVLLTISIATILQIETYGAKKLLPPLIIAALFINFSFLVTQYVIYSSNLLTVFFLPGVTDVQSSFIGGAPSGSASKSLSVKFLAGVNPNAMFASANFGKGFEEIEKVQNKLEEVKRKYSEDISAAEEVAISAEEKQLSNELKTKLSSKDFTTTTIQLGIAIAGTAVFILVAMFALAFAGIALLIRVVILWFLMILSPIAFLFFVIPGLSGEAQKWWQALLKQAFFAPGFFFLFGLTVEMISSGNAQALFKAAPKMDSAFITNFTLIGYYILLIIMLLASIAFAKSFGTYSGEWALKGAKAARGYALGYAGRVAKRYGGGAAGIVLESAPARWLSKVPIARQALRPIAAAARTAEQQAEEDAKRLKGLSPKAQASMMPTLNARAQANAFRGMKDDDAEDMMKAMSDTNKVGFGQRMEPYNLHRKAAAASKEFKIAMQIMYNAPAQPPPRNTPQGQEYYNNLNEFIDKLKPQQLGKFNLREAGLYDPQTQTYVGDYLPDAMFKNLTGTKVSELIKIKENAAALTQIMRDKAQNIPGGINQQGNIDKDILAQHVQTNYQNAPFAKFIKNSPAAGAIL